MTGSVRVLDVPDLERPLYRIYPLWFFEDALSVNSGRLVLVRPRSWEDPHEDIAQVMAAQEPSGHQKMLAGLLQPAYAQCWSLNGDSDVLMRAYSRVTKDPVTSRNMDPRNEGVMVSTTPRKLIQAVNTWTNSRKNLTWQFYLVGIRYRDDFPDFLAHQLRTLGPRKFCHGDERVNSLRFKRSAFEHESEVRLICLTNRENKEKLISVDINPNNLFTGVQFDPRLAPFERIEREKMTRARGYQGPFLQNNRYQGALFNVVMVDTCDNLDAQPDPPPH